MDWMEMSYCVLILSGAFALICLGLFLIQLASSAKEATLLMKMTETTVTKVNHILDDVDEKLEMMSAPIECISGFFSRGFMNSGLGILSSLMRKKKKER